MPEPSPGTSSHSTAVTSTHSASQIPGMRLVPMRQTVSVQQNNSPSTRAVSLATPASDESGTQVEADTENNSGADTSNESTQTTASSQQPQQISVRSRRHYGRAEQEEEEPAGAKAQSFFNQKVIPASTVISLVAMLIFGVGAWVGMNYANSYAEKSYDLALFSACHDYEDAKDTKFCKNIVEEGLTKFNQRMKRDIGNATPTGTLNDFLTHSKASIVQSLRMMQFTLWVLPMNFRFHVPNLWSPGSIIIWLWQFCLFLVIHLVIYFSWRSGLKGMGQSFPDTSVGLYLTHLFTYKLGIKMQWVSRIWRCLWHVELAYQLGIRFASGNVPENYGDQYSVYYYVTTVTVMLCYVLANFSFAPDPTSRNILICSLVGFLFVIHPETVNILDMIPCLFTRALYFGAFILYIPSAEKSGAQADIAGFVVFLDLFYTKTKVNYGRQCF
ncbi:hypothetical protein F5Y04DRAFT_123085 [Hypomontagnella monticulosa]|nr:hypothetical protein F5Y04DRAFT_123085 [Hypomontagnella monticulosa]